MRRPSVASARPLAWQLITLISVPPQLERSPARCRWPARALGRSASTPSRARPAGAPAHLQPAQERGFEGVACVDDAARAVVLYCALFRTGR